MGMKVTTASLILSIIAVLTYLNLTGAGLASERRGKSYGNYRRSAEGPHQKARVGGLR